ncbi:methylenetetrahydrofolate reductase isoform X2 [Leptopilina boulardi]|uniref:methylenetetrahydrofolate reductase isoform X2 n=1 Tax=Leptopilina boulardi TaxID=63433 RepID=UPI0021F68BF6|nr:methylenetetrahydrofolate reductase isoform X2 [Leptopilina boulardi]
MNVLKVEDISKDTNIFNWENYSKMANKNTHLIKLIEETILKKEKFYSIELVSEKDFENYQRFFDEKRKLFPLFQSVTWHCKENANKLDIKNIEPLKIIEKLPSNTLLHLAARGLTKETVKTILNRANELNVKNIFALQGEEPGEFSHASDLVTFIRQEFNSFCICVAGYPEMHPKSQTKEQDLFWLKAKIDAGADFIISQIFFDAQIFIKFVKDCRLLNITVPIIPGIFPITNYKSLKKISTICHVEIPQNLLSTLEIIKDNDEKVEKFGKQFTKELINEVLQSGFANGFHLFTFNRLSTIADILEM